MLPLPETYPGHACYSHTAYYITDTPSCWAWRQRALSIAEVPHEPPRFPGPAARLILSPMVDAAAQHDTGDGRAYRDILRLLIHFTSERTGKKPCAPGYRRPRSRRDPSLPGLFGALSRQWRPYAQCALDRHPLITRYYFLACEKPTRSIFPVRLPTAPVCALCTGEKAGPNAPIAGRRVRSTTSLCYALLAHFYLVHLLGTTSTANCLYQLMSGLSPVHESRRADRWVKYRIRARLP